MRIVTTQVFSLKSVFTTLGSSRDESSFRCIERKGWKQVRSQQEQEQMRDAITSELAQTEQPTPRSDSKAAEAFVHGLEERLARASNSAR
jgi:hypothetical protein